MKPRLLSKAKVRMMRMENRQGVQWAIAGMAERGFHARTIAQYTGLSINQVHYYLHKNKLRLRTYRDGDNIHAREILNEHQIVPVVRVVKHKE